MVHLVAVAHGDGGGRGGGRGESGGQLNGAATAQGIAPVGLVVVAVGVQGLDFLGRGMNPDLAVVCAGGADQVARHDVVGDRVAPGRNAQAQAGGAVGVEGFSAQVEVVGRHLRQRAAQGVAGDGDGGCDATLSSRFFLCELQRFAG
ncbi:hypothetical protein D9M69_486390 [compost metagenome]